MLSGCVEAAGALVIVTGTAVALVGPRLVAVRPEGSGRAATGQRAFLRIRLVLGRFPTLGLDQLAADLLRTAVAPSCGETGQLAASPHPHRARLLPRARGPRGGQGGTGHGERAVSLPPAR